MINEVFFDVETKKLFSEIEGVDPGKLGVSIVSVYQRTLDEKLNEVEGQIASFWEEEFEKMWPVFQQATRVIGFNSLHFDNPALEPYANFPFRKLPHFDIFALIKDAVGRRIGLNALTSETLGVNKSGQGLIAVEYWAKGDKENLKKYCEQDVLLTKDLYDFGLKNKYLKFKDRWNTVRTVKINFSYSPKDSNNKQIGLF